MEVGSIGTLQLFYMGEDLQLWWHRTCTLRAAKVGSILIGNLKGCSASGVSMRSIQDKCFSISQPNGQLNRYTQGIKIQAHLCSRIQNSMKPLMNASNMDAQLQPILQTKFPLVGWWMNNSCSSSGNMWHTSTGDPAHLSLCGDLTHLQNNSNVIVTTNKHPKVCHIYGEPAYSKWGLVAV